MTVTITDNSYDKEKYLFLDFREKMVGENLHEEGSGSSL